MTAQEIIAAVLFILGTLIFVSVTIGVNKFKYVLNRMHAAAMGDTLGVLLMVLGCVVCYGFSFATLKCVLVLAFLWFSSPVASHLIAKLEILTHPEKNGVEYEIRDLADVERECDEEEAEK